MPKYDSIEVNNRRILIVKYLVDGLKPNQIKEKIPNISIDTIYDDIKFIKRKALKSMTKLSRDALAFNYDNMISQMDLIYSESRIRLQQDNLSNQEFISLSKLNRETITEKRELLKEACSIFEIEKLKAEVKELKELNNNPNTNNFMNQGLPHYNNSRVLTK